MAAPKIKASVQLCTLDDVREFIDKKGTANEEPSDQLIGRMIDRFSLWFEQKCNREFLLAEYKRYYQGNGSNVMHSQVAPIVPEADQITTPLVESFDGDVWTDVTAALNVDFTDPNNIGEMIALGGIWAKTAIPFYNYRVTLTAGYGTSAFSVPDDVRNAATIGSDILLRYRSMGIHVLSTQSNVDGVSWASRNLSPNDRDNLAFVTDVVGSYRFGW